MMDDKCCETCLHYDFKKCSIDGKYVGREWFCKLWEEVEDD